MSDEMVENVAGSDAGQASADMLEEIRSRCEAGEELTDEQLDFVADTSVEIVRAILGYFGEPVSWP